MVEYKIFIASSMLNPFREECSKIIADFNNYRRDVNFDVCVYGESPIEDVAPDTQDQINRKAAESDLVLLLADNNATIGRQTMREYYTAHLQSLQSLNGRPYIKVFALRNNKDEAVSVQYYTEDGSCANFEKKLYDDSKRYVQYVEKDNFEKFFKEWLVLNANNGLGHNLTRRELSYGDHIHSIMQGAVRKSNKMYYRRDSLDGEIERVLNFSPIVILEGNTYSGKTRAAFEIMKSRAEWGDYNFHIYNNCDTVAELNDIKLDFTGRGDVYLFDDINDIIKDGEGIDYNNSPLWRKLNGYNRCKGFSLEEWGNTRVIITVSGRLSLDEKKKLYGLIFHSEGTAFENELKKIIVNFDIYDSRSFRQMANEMVRDGVLSSAKIRPGNYTIGSLFINTEDIRRQAEDEYNENNSLLTSLVGHFKYATKSRFTGLCSEIGELYDFVAGEGVPAGTFQDADGRVVAARELFAAGVERLRKKGLVVVSEDDENGSKVWIDRYILDIFNEVVLENMKYADVCGAKALNAMLIAYAKRCEQDRGADSELERHHICYVAQMGYLLLDRNTLGDDEIMHIVALVARALSVNSVAVDNFLNGRLNANAISSYIMVLVQIARLKGRYPRIFSVLPIARIRNFNSAQNFIKASSAYHKHCRKEQSDIYPAALELYKRAVYAMLSAGNRRLTMKQEKIILNYIFDDGGKWKEPFDSSDLHDVFNLVDVIPFIKDMNALQIIELLETATLDGYDMAQFLDEANNGASVVNSSSNPSYDEENYDFSNLEEPIDAEGLPRNVYEKVFLVQLANAVAAAVSSVDSYDKFLEAANAVCEMCIRSVHVKRAVSGAFAANFYRTVPRIVKNFSYDDRTKLFEFVISIDDTKGVFGNLDIRSNVDFLKTLRVIALNRLLECLDENDALRGYREMQSRGLSDGHTLSFLLKNESLSFEQLLQLVAVDANFVILNQLMGKAETESDAHVCMMLMGVADGDASKLKDESALVKFMKIRSVDGRRCIDIIKRRRKLYPANLTDTAVGVLMNKLKMEQLIDIFFPSESNSAEGYYMQQYGLKDDEVRSARENAILINKMMFRANSNACSNDVALLMKQKFDDIVNDRNLRYLITDPEYNGNSGIMSVYMKNRFLFSDYDGVRAFCDDFVNKYPMPKCNHIYSVFLGYIVDGYERNIYKREEAIELMNSELIKAYEEFAEFRSKDEVVAMMAELYRYRLKLVKEGCYDTPEEFVYEGERMSVTYKEYLEYLKNHNTFYVDGTFIYIALEMMQKSIDGDVYDLLGDIASHNHIGVQYDTIYSARKDSVRKGLSRAMQQCLMSYDIENNLLKIDHRLVRNVSYIKALWFLQQHDKKITFDQVESCREANNIPMTQTYLNMAFKGMEIAITDAYKESDRDINVLLNGFRSMIEYMHRHIDKNPTLLYRSIQMCISLISVAPNEPCINRLFTVDGFACYRNRAEVISAVMNKLIKLRYKAHVACATLNQFRREIIGNCANVNVRTLNAYLSVYVRITKFELLVENGRRVNFAPLEKCWDILKKERKLDLFTLLEVRDCERGYILECLKLGSDERWMIEANVQTFSYFAEYSPTLISTMDEMFDGNFTYDDQGRNSCLKDAIKNYGYAFKNNPKYPVEEVGRISEIITRIGNRGLFEELCSEYILRSQQDRKSGEWKEMEDLWDNLLSFNGFTTQLVYYICRLAADTYKWNKLLQLNLNDFSRVGILSSDLELSLFNESVVKKVNETYESIKSRSNDRARRDAGRVLEIMRVLFGLA